MSSAWETTKDDVRNVLEKHGISDEEVIEEAVEMIENEDDRITEAALAYTGMDDQTASAYDEIENVLIENRVIEAEKLFAAP